MPDVRLVPFDTSHLDGFRALLDRFARLEGGRRSLHVKPGLREDTELWSRLVTDS